MYTYANKIILILFFSIFIYAETYQDININNNIIISTDSLLESTKIQKDIYIKTLMNKPYKDKKFYPIWEKVHLLKQKDKESLEMLENALKKSTNNDIKLNSYIEGLISFISGNYTKAFPLLKTASNLGNKDALYLYALYFTPYLGNEVNIPKFYFLLKQSIVGGSKLPFYSQLRWWKLKNIKPLFKTSGLIKMLETKSLITIKDLKKLNEYVYIPHTYKISKNNFDKIAKLTLLFKTIFYTQGKYTSLDKQDLSKSTNQTSLANFLEFKFDETKCNKIKPYIYTNNYQAENKCGKNLPFKKFINKIQAGDVCLVTNKKAHHYLTIYSINYKSKKIYFIDSWTQNSFLLEKNNILGLKGKVINIPQGSLIELSFEDYQYSVVGCVQRDLLSSLTNKRN